MLNNTVLRTMVLQAKSLMIESRPSFPGKWMAAAVFGGLFLVGCTTTTMSDAERDARMAECQLIDDDDERRECLERLALGDEVDPAPPTDPIN